MKQNKGFTLIEVLVALLILAVALTAIAEATSNDIRSLTYLQNRTISQWVGLNILNSMQAGLIPSPAESAQKGETQMLNKTWYWTASKDSAGSTPYTLRVNIDISTQQDQPAITHLVGFIRQ